MLEVGEKLGDDTRARRRAPLVEVRGLSKAYGTTPVVKGLDFDIYPGETLALLGPSGCGKSTTLKLLAGLEQPDEGTIKVGDSLIADAEKNVFQKPEQRNMGLVFQNYAIWPHMTVRENVRYPLRLRKLGRDQTNEKVQRILDIVGMSGYEDRPSDQLSGGQQQRVALARSLVYEPDILLLDEPLSNLDTKLRHEMRAQIKRLQALLNTTLLFVTHDQAEAMSLAHRIAVMNSGEIEQVGSPEEIYDQPASHFVHQFMGHCMSFSGELHSSGERLSVVVGDDATFDVDSAGNTRWPEGQHRVQVSIRHEDLEPTPFDPDDRHNRLPALVEDLWYVGGKYECSLQLTDHRLVLEVPRRFAFRPGQQLDLRVDRAAVWIWPDGFHPTEVETG